MKIRHANITDLDAILAIEQANFSENEAATASAVEERLKTIRDTFLILEMDHEIAGYIEGPVLSSPYLTDDLFHHVNKNPQTGGYIAVTSLSVAPKFQKQGIGTTLLAALKDLAVEQKRQGIILTCHDYLIAYYEMNGFEDRGLSDSQHGGAVWYDMIWENKH
ncbi:hypothetical protein HMPREF9318_01159 [Streptococcus urinalis FB127-CNA-2]|uniref:Acetyltransferase, GNAT family n=1 Tax=Streptococcus urinalis 2285-97 TaxID=764291 RepID=G5KI33_9STRE|nr:GNAT family N-acetyltransferase [Streptococcus urinalis]EHJ57699.1 acetyltransferase, GNAT family [Streptococcus urinalis 2285-97]EKS20521.1 hypothetical protein HMPREF9318_01159 [Streptococcus urinalis FB127-CNA-2]VEF31214.1 GNAT family acetyltransferase [Streptococcus urinalis]